jgi:hypothetical protein
VQYAAIDFNEEFVRIWEKENALYNTNVTTHNRCIIPPALSTKSIVTEKLNGSLKTFLISALLYKF